VGAASRANATRRWARRSTPRYRRRRARGASDVTAAGPVPRVRAPRTLDPARSAALPRSRMPGVSRRSNEIARAPLTANDQHPLWWTRCSIRRHHGWRRRSRRT
jgi:hypothetical protein